MNSQEKHNKIFNKKFSIKMAFIAVSALMWFLTKLSYPSYNEVFSYNVVVETNNPELVVTQLSESFVTVKVTGSGYDLLSENTADLKEVNLTLEDADKLNDQTYEWDTRKNLELISDQLPQNLEIVNVSPRSIIIKTDKLTKKKIAVELNYEVNLETPYRLYGKLEITPPEVEVWMPQENEGKLNRVKTELLKIEQTDAEQIVKVELQVLDEKLVVKPKFVNVKFSVKPYTQKKIEVPIQFKNLPVNGQVKLFPPNITVTINVAQDDYDKIDASSFICVADFNLLIEDDSRVPLRLEKIPEGIDLIDWRQKSVEFLIIEE